MYSLGVINERISDVHFRRMFRMTSECLDLLCQRNIVVGEGQFKPEVYIGAFIKGKDQMCDVIVLTSGGYVSGEVKFDITLRLLGW